MARTATKTAKKYDGPSREDRLADAHATLTAAVDQLTTGADWQRMLDVASRFHDYSMNNLFLILMQNPDATRVAGYRAWQAMDRQVRKGEKSIRILAPVTYKRPADPDDSDSPTVKRLVGFTTVSVFDISQTDGEPLPEPVRPELLDGEAPEGLYETLAVQVNLAGFTLVRGDPGGGTNGRTDYTSRTVTVRADVSDAQAVRTLAHELAHILLDHESELGGGCRGRLEVEAESVAYLVASASGLDSTGYSAPYVARWAQGDRDLVERTARRVVECARKILVVSPVPEPALV